jgi:hypothetical protein
MCSAWVYDYDAFEEWALNSGYSEDLTIERIDNDGDYSPGNCRWATRFEQAQNQSFTKFVEYDGVDCSVSEACRRAGFDKTVFYDYLKESGCSHQEVFDFMLVKKALNVRLLRQKTKNTL